MKREKLNEHVIYGFKKTINHLCELILNEQGKSKDLDSRLRGNDKGSSL